MGEFTVRDRVLQATVPGARWLSTGWNGGYSDGAAAYNITVPDGWNRTDLTSYIEERLAQAGFTADGPALLTGVDMRHAVGARLDPVWAVATVGLSNPATLPLDPPEPETDPSEADSDSPEIGTVNLLVGTERALDDGGLATLLGAVVEAKTATLQQRTGFTGTTSDAVIVGTDRDGEPSAFSGSATDVGAAARAAVREAVVAATDARYADGTEIPDSVDAADSGRKTTERATVFEV